MQPTDLLHPIADHDAVPGFSAETSARAGRRGGGRHAVKR
jgi:hypothetical protein